MIELMGYPPGEWVGFSMSRMYFVHLRDIQVDVVKLLVCMRNYYMNSGKHHLPREEMKMNNALPSDILLNSYS